MNVPYLEVAGITLSLLYLWLELEQKTAMWWVGIFSALLYMAIFFSAKLYASMGLHLYYLAASAYGLAVWRFGSKKAEQPLRVTPVRRRQLAVAAASAAALWAALYLILSRYTDSPVPLGDAFTTALSIVGMYGLAHKILHHWLLWLVADGAGAALCLWQGLHVTAALYVIYSAAAVYGFFRWKRDMGKEEGG